MSVTAQLFLKGRPSVDANDIVGAFVGGELRGTARVAPRTTRGADVAGQQPRLARRLLERARGETRHLQGVGRRRHHAGVLHAHEPHARLPGRRDRGHADAPGRHQRAVRARARPRSRSTPGGRGSSFNRVPQGAKVAGVLAPIFGVNPLAGDVFKSQRTFAMYSGAGAVGAWVGPLADTLARPAAGVPGAPVGLAGARPRRLRHARPTRRRRCRSRAGGTGSASRARSGSRSTHGARERRASAWRRRRTI